MKIIRNEAHITRLRRISQLASFVGLTILLAGLYLSLQGNPQYIMVQWFVLLFGIILWQVSLNYAYKYVRRPRPDELLDSALKAAVPSSYLYHYMLPASHVLLTRSGPVVLVPKTQTGRISVAGAEGDRWKRKGSLFRRILGQEPALGNPTKEATQELSKLVKFIAEHAPELDELPISTMIVFTAPLGSVTLDLEQSRIPAVHTNELKKLIRKHTGRPLPKEQYTRLQEIFGDGSNQEAVIEKA
jgi:hypothetical protein